MRRTAGSVRGCRPAHARRRERCHVDRAVDLREPCRHTVQSPLGPHLDAEPHHQQRQQHDDVGDDAAPRRLEPGPPSSLGHWRHSVLSCCPSYTVLAATMMRSTSARPASPGPRRPMRRAGCDANPPRPPRRRMVSAGTPISEPTASSACSSAAVAASSSGEPAGARRHDPAIGGEQRQHECRGRDAPARREPDAVPPGDGRHERLPRPAPAPSVRGQIRCGQLPEPGFDVVRVGRSWRRPQHRPEGARSPAGTGSRPSISSRSSPWPTRRNVRPCITWSTITSRCSTGGSRRAPVPARADPPHRISWRRPARGRLAQRLLGGHRAMPLVVEEGRPQHPMEVGSSASDAQQAGSHARELHEDVLHRDPRPWPASA